MRKRQSILFCGLLAASVFLSTGCGALHMFEKSENERRTDAWKEELEEKSAPDSARQEKIRADLDGLVRDTPARRTDAQSGLSRHGPPTEAEVEELRKNSTELSPGERMKRSAKAMAGIPVFFLYGLMASPGQP